MKRTLLLLSTVALIMLSACSKESAIAVMDNAAIYDAFKKPGTWRVANYWDTDHDETANYAGYVLTFNSSNKTLIAAKATDIINGTWKSYIDDDKAKLDLSFSTPGNFQKFNDDWYVTDVLNNITKIRMMHTSSNGNTEYLTIEKN